MTTTETTRTAVEFETALASFLVGVQKIYDDYMATEFPKNSETYTVTFPVMRGHRYIRVVRHETAKSTGEVTSRSSHCFIDYSNGDVLKCDGWKKPAKHARGNIYADDNGLKCMTAYGAAYLR